MITIDGVTYHTVPEVSKYLGMKKNTINVISQKLGLGIKLDEQPKAPRLLSEDDIMAIQFRKDKRRKE